MADFLTNVGNLIKQHEGFRADPYTDTTGHQTIGYGHNLDSTGISYNIPLSVSDAEKLLWEDINKVIAWISTYSWWNNLTDNRKMCLIDMGFNLGKAGLNHFTHMISALANSDYVEAANQMKASLWYKQVGHRGLQDYLLMQRG
jgi:lysozyme